MSLQRFIDAQQSDYETALSEIKRGRKQSHWMWYIFPQIQGLGFSATSKLYAIKNLQEARQYLQHPLLGKRLKEITNALIDLPSNNAHEIFGSPDDVKLKSSMTLFASLPGADPVFESALKKFFNGERDAKTLSIIKDE
ncbi:DUF1810 domain-containing protein [Hanamia caeni]|jgi:uncharacterized protein (DUF1810 family)|uniref:DUF1810 domain-containing protein n=1 Tax=Hanamia caeni TaxID=2294116 RepID=A0A3M9ND78_9BACT|nr:DUF1810 domain-containing protein [Hanamia caeni]RNI35724.1 DUF1810 domain-containing protein [Hanamia caeni]